MSRKHDVSSILKRAADLGMVLYVEGDELKVLAPRGLPQLTKALEVIKGQKPAIMAHLRSIKECPLCSTCLDEGRETEATRELADFMYCEEHYSLALARAS
ncbi:hypothetical protein [Ktedonospora formicarum]|uniref:TubC N-terminal docking domain-containing protein n=1 Tax=Ktedonospora formicarum TaxID=2778364 RepID=A0A8J3IHZ8_9CHLR|nr:hypothetical protein [Ktedonospora formicarum]GHO51494.1 hypothetical protein KSX_96570 [Ktedonospora formicarum]GHO51519.1 hypothetical protein KSX_96820 [Ktedonospora formicarum]